MVRVDLLFTRAPLEVQVQSGETPYGARMDGDGPQ